MPAMIFQLTQWWNENQQRESHLGIFLNLKEEEEEKGVEEDESFDKLDLMSDDNW